jgi:hypothetical protein
MLADDQLSAPERALRDAIPSGKVVDLRPNEARTKDDPAQGAQWGPERTVRAELIRELLVVEPPAGAPPPRALKLLGARIEGELDLEDESIRCPPTLQGCFFEYPINLQEARAASLTLSNSRAPGLNAQQLETRGNVELNEFAAEGEVWLPGAKIGGQLNLNGASLINPGGRALTAWNVSVGGGMYCRGFVAQGEVQLAGGKVNGQLDLSGARLGNAGALALSADGANVTGGMTFQDLAADGEVSLNGARVSAQLILGGASLSNPGGRALTADNVSVEGSMVCRGFVAQGEVRLSGATLGGQLNLRGARLGNAGAPALRANGVSVARDMFCRAGFIAVGEIQLISAHVGGELDFSGATLANTDGKALNLRGLSATDLILVPRTRPIGAVDLTDARIGRFADEQATWPTVLHLRGCEYDVLVDISGSDVDVRLRWLELNEGGYAPQIYDQLAAAYHRDGRDEAARDVLVAKQRRRRKELGSPGKAWNSLLHVTVGYGYKPYYALIWLGILLAIGTVVFNLAYPAHMLATTGTPPAFHDWVYALDTLLPVVDLGQQSNWNPEGAAQYVSYLLIAGGWVLSTALVAALSGLIKRD